MPRSGSPIAAGSLTARSMPPLPTTALSWSDSTPMATGNSKTLGERIGVRRDISDCSLVILVESVIIYSTRLFDLCHPSYIIISLSQLTSRRGPSPFNSPLSFLTSSTPSSLSLSPISCFHDHHLGWTDTFFVRCLAGRFIHLISSC